MFKYLKALILSIFFTLNMAVTIAASPESEIQSILTEQGYNIGAIDGAVGKKTLSKLKDFCQLHTLDCKPYIAEKNYVKVLSLINSVQGLDVRTLAPFSQIASENMRRPNQVKHLGAKGVAVGNFSNQGDDLELFIVATPKAYNKYLWGQQTSFFSLPKSYTKAGLRKAKDLNWIDKMSFKNRLNTELKPIKIEGSEEFCLHNRSPVSADFNSDGIDDILVPCHGYDGYPFPGDHSYVILSQGNQVFKAIKITTKKGFYHGGTIFDVNNDGYVDAVLTDANSGKITAYLNDGHGSFSKPKTILSNLKFNYTISSYDFNNDGAVDFILGGHEYNGNKLALTTKIYLNDGAGKFRSKRFYRIPKIREFSTVLGYLVHKNFLFVLRTSSSYVGGAIQQIDLDTMKQVAVLSKTNGRSIRKLRRVHSLNLVTFGNLDQNRTQFDFNINAAGKIWFVH